MRRVWEGVEFLVRDPNKSHRWVFGDGRPPESTRHTSHFAYSVYQGEGIVGDGTWMYGYDFFPAGSWRSTIYGQLAWKDTGRIIVHQVGQPENNLEGAPLPSEYCGAIKTLTLVSPGGVPPILREIGLLPTHIRGKKPIYDSRAKKRFFPLGIPLRDVHEE